MDRTKHTMNTEEKRKKEQRVVEEMIRLYCRSVHQQKTASSPTIDKPFLQALY